VGLADGNPEKGPICECGHPPVAHGDPGWFGTNTLCLEPDCLCERYQDTFEVDEDDE